MSTLRTLRKLIFGETWLVPAGVALVLLTGALVGRALMPDAWAHGGGFFLLAGILAVLATSVARGARPRTGDTSKLDAE